MSTGIILLAVALGRVAVAQDDVADIHSELRKLKPEKLQYHLISKNEKLQPPEKGYKLLIVMPGGDGSTDFLPFVKRIFKYALSDQYVVAQLVAPKWAEQQVIVWPTARDKVQGQKASVEDFISQCVDDVKTKTRIDERHVYTLSWSSGGPAAYAASLHKDTPVKGSFVAMSVFWPNRLPNLRPAKDKSYYIFHSQQDQVCQYWMATSARDKLREAGANVELAEYEGGHGWMGNVFGNIRKGIEWLEAKSEKGGSVAAESAPK
jgi:predicted esterase